MERNHPLAYLATLGVLLAMALGGCSFIQKPCQDPNSCECASNQNPSCAPFPNDNGDNPSQMAKKPDGGSR